MALHYILDGYNIIKSDPSGTLARGSLEEQRKRLFDCIRKNRPQGSERNSVTVVFDGPSSVPFLGGGASRSWSGEIEIYFSEGRTADETIEELVHADPNPAELVVVTDDRGIHRLLGGSGARHMGVPEFLRRLLRPARGENEAGDEGFDDISEEFKRKWLK